METTYTWEDEPGATRMTLRNRGTPRGFSAWLAPLMSTFVPSANRKDLALLKRRLESHATRFNIVPSGTAAVVRRRFTEIQLLHGSSTERRYDQIAMLLVTCRRRKSWLKWTHVAPNSEGLGPERTGSGDRCSHSNRLDPADACASQASTHIDEDWFVHNQVKVRTV
jgi:hypothetical protein